LKSVECSDLNTDTWKPVANMFKNCQNAGVEVLDGIMYAVGGGYGNIPLNSVEDNCPKTNVVLT